VAALTVSRRIDMRRWTIIIIALVALLAIVAGVWKPWSMTQAQWLAKTTQELRSCVPPPAYLVTNLPPGRWVAQRYLIFSNDWACFAYHTFHRSERIGDVALLRGADGSFYISRYHFCAGLPEDPDAPQPKDLADFLKTYGTDQQWKRLSSG
jgi:hypothetical protein